MTRVSRDVFAFLAELRRHNNREWFNENKDRYLADVRVPMLALIASLAPGLARISRHISVDPGPSDGSLMRLVHDRRRVQRAPGLRAGLSSSFRRGVWPRGSADAVPGQGAWGRLLTRALLS